MNSGYVFGLNEGEFEPIPDKKMKVWELTDEITENDFSLRLFKALKSLNIRTWEDFLKHTEDTIILPIVYQYGELSECLIFYNIYLPTTPVEEEMLNAFEEAGLPFGRDDLRYCLGYSSNFSCRKKIINILRWKMKKLPTKYKLQKLLEAKEIIKIALE